MGRRINDGQLKAIQGLFQEIDEEMKLLQKHRANLENWSCSEACHAVIDLQAILMTIRSVVYHQECSVDKVDQTELKEEVEPLANFKETHKIVSLDTKRSRTKR